MTTSPMTGRPFDAVLCDLDNVIRFYDMTEPARLERAIYEIAAERAGVAMHRCLFVDDRPENVEAAAGLGMTGVHYRGPADLRGPLGFLLDS
ncbi:HAD-IA family hydrolase [Streptomyces sp. NPDC047049]|uniref:HAD-IA family hydrolase n=1 Tax=Streptomyces sp. NPDC047049 TaxID=3156688 RepID=UPI0033C96580